MKRSMKSLLALVLVAVLTLGNLSGLGPVVSEAADATIRTVEATKTAVSKDGENLEITVTGENLPEKLFYKRVWVGLDEFGGDFDYYVDGSAVEVDATGDANSRTIVVPMPAASEYPSASGWKVAVDTNQYGTFSKKNVKKITIDGLEIPATPEIQTVEVSKESVSAAGETVTVTVKGTALPETLYYKVLYIGQYGDSAVNYAGTSVKTTGTEEERTFEVAIPAKSTIEFDMTGWKVSVALAQYGTYVKSGAMSVAAEETPDTPVAPEVDNKVLNVKVVDKDGNPVSGVDLMLKSEYGAAYDVQIGKSDADGKLAYTLKGEVDSYMLQPSASSDFTCDEPAEIFVGTDSDWNVIVETVNDEEYTGEVTLVVEKEEEDVKADPVLTSIEAAKTSVSKDGETLTITVKGENLPDTLYYALKYTAPGLYGGTEDNTIDWTGNAVAATGTATEKTIEVPLPSTTTYPNALSWKVGVGLSSNTYDGTYKTTPEIKIDGVEVPATPEIQTVEVSKESVSAAGETVTVTVKGTALPETLYYKVLYIGQYGDSAVNYAGTSVKTTGTEEERTFEVAIPAKSTIEFDMTGWKVSVALAQYGTYVKSGAMSVAAEETPDTPVAPEVDNKVLNVKVVDKDGNPVAGVPLVLKGMYYSTVKIGTTDENGTLSYALRYEAEDYTLKPADDSGFNCEKPAEIYIGENDDFEPIVETVNEEDYTGEVTLVVEKEEVKADPVLTSIEAAKTSVSKDGETLTITVKGENLPDTLYYALKYTAPGLYGGTEDNTVDWTGKAVAATGTATEKTIEVPLPSTTTYPKALSWKVCVGLSSSLSDGTYKTTPEIAIDGVEVPATPEIQTVEVSKESVSAAGETVTVTVKGTALPETLYYKVLYIGQYGDSAVNYAGTSVKATGTEEERTFEVAIPAKSTIEFDITGWKVSVALAQYGSYVKSGEMSIVEDETPEVPEVDKTELLAKITALAGLKAEDYTVASFKALQVAINEATKVFNNEEATEEEVAEALAALQAAEDGLIALADLPKAPESVKAVLSGAYNTVKVTWSEVEGADGYLVSYKKAADETWSEAVATTATSYTQKDLAGFTTYEFKVTPYVDKNGAVYDEAQSKTVEIKTKKDVKAPATVKATLSGGHDDVKVSWSKVKGADSYRVYYKKSTSTSYTLLTTTAKLSATKKNLTDGVKYTFKVVPCYKDGDTTVTGFYSKTASVYTLKKLATPKVSKVNSKKVKVSWTNIYGESGYQISRSTKKTGTNIVSTYSTTSGKTKTLSVTKGKKYYYKVRAYKTVDGKKIYGPWSNVKAYTLK